MMHSKTKIVNVMMCDGQRSSAIAVRPCDTILVSSCYASPVVAVRKVSVSKSDLHGHSRALELVPFNRQRTISY